MSDFCLHSRKASGRASLAGAAQWSKVRELSVSVHTAHSQAPSGDKTTQFVSKR